MLNSFILVSLLSLVASAANVCTQVPYLALLPLSGYAPAKSFCSSKYPVTPCTSVTTTTVTVTIPKTVATTTVITGTDVRTSIVATATVTTVTGVVTVTSTIATTTISVATSTITSTITSGTTTKCIYGPNDKRGLVDAFNYEPMPQRGRFDRRADPLSVLLSKILASPTSIAKQACSCITGSKPCITSTATTSSTTSVSLTATTSIAASSIISRTTTTTLSTASTTQVSISATSTIPYDATTTVIAQSTERVGCGCSNGCNPCNSSDVCPVQSTCKTKGDNSGPVLNQNFVISDLACRNYCCNIANCGAFQWQQSNLECKIYAVGDAATSFSSDPDFVYGVVTNR